MAMKLTKRQAHVMELSKQLPKDMSKSASMWARENLFPKVGYYAKKGDVWCQCCGAQFVEPHAMLEVSIGCGETYCPECRAWLKLEHAPRKKIENKRAYYTIATVVDGWQVLRTYEVWRINLRGRWTEWNFQEVYQNWIDGKGNEVVLAHDYSRSFNSFQWKVETPMRPKRWRSGYVGYYAFDNPFEVWGHGNSFFPGGRFTKTLYRDGMSIELCRKKLNIVELMQGLIKGKDHIEEMVKTRQIAILEKWQGNGAGFIHDIDNWLHAMRICNRNGYVVEDASMWFDHLELLRWHGKDTHNAKYVCPDNLRHEHDVLLRKRHMIEEKRRQEAEAKEARQHEEKYYKSRHSFMGLVFTGTDLVVRPLQSVAEFVEEGKAMHHCVYSMGYYDTERHPYSLILSARDSQGKRIETIEVNIKKGTIIQSRGVCNQNTARHSEICQLVTNHMAEILRTAHTAKRNKITKAL